MRTVSGGVIRSMLVSLAAFAVIFGCVWLVLSDIGSASVEVQADMVEDAVRNAAVTCYASEGSYPSDIAYLKENYALTYDEDRFYVYYSAFASNVMPDVRVIIRGGN